MPKITLQKYLEEYVLKITLETLYMVGISAIIATIIAIIFGSVLYNLRKSSNKSCQVIYKILDVLVNLFRSLPFLILIFWLIPFTRSIMKVFTGVSKFTGNTAAIVPLTIAAIPFFTKIIENALVEVDEDVIEAAISLGLNRFQIITKVVIKEALPAIVSGITLGLITLVGYSAMAGAVGAGGIGNFAIIYGQQNYDMNAIIYSVVTAILLVEAIQLIGNCIYKLVK
ncbi:MAG TPA: methionine ABC transporter permease [Acholeplasmatales bacterium]|nr:ABC transporter permease subunit [Bacilli bacterium]MBS5852446.1 ABC transporter permease subunit [Staphylococcus sp.]HAR58320.1 methionine ABC transporter permease [Acholeplasmatales bacterium]